MRTIYKFAILTFVSSTLLVVACKKEQSSNSVPTPVNIFTTQVPPDRTLNDSIWTDSTGIQIGLKFQSSVPILISGIKYFKTAANIGQHVGQIYSSTGDLLASQEFSSESDSGWQSATFATPVKMAANTTFIASCFSSLGYYNSSDWTLYANITNGTLTILADGKDGPNGVFKYTNSPAFPDSSFRKTNYWIDIIEQKQ